MPPDDYILLSCVKKRGGSMSEYTDRFEDRRTGTDRRDWDEYVMQNRRAGPDRRAGLERRRKQLPFAGEERRKLKTPRDYISSYAQNHNINAASFPLFDASRLLGISASDILDWIRWKWVNEADFKRDAYGRFVFSKCDMDKLLKIKLYIAGKK